MRPHGNIMGRMNDHAGACARRLARKGFSLGFAYGSERNAARMLAVRILGVSGQYLDPPVECLVCTAPSHALAGGLFLQAQVGTGRTSVMIRALAVAERWRGRGVGSALLWAAGRAARSGAVLYGGCSESNQGFYLANGFIVLPSGCPLVLPGREEALIADSVTYDRWFVSGPV